MVAFLQMARIFGTIGSLKSLKIELEKSGIDSFRSVKEINTFLSNFDKLKKSILNHQAYLLQKEYKERSIKLNQIKKSRSEIIHYETEKIETQIMDLKFKIDSISKRKVNLFKRFYLNIRKYLIQKNINQIINDKRRLFDSSLQNIDLSIKKEELFINEYEKDIQSLILKRAKSKINKIEYNQKVLENCKNFISGAIGENLVVNEIKKLSDDYILINDFNLHCSPPIYYKKYNQRIHSVQIDHLLISKSGIFIIETKNWSKSSVNSIHLRSPIKQIQRANYALYMYMKKNISINNHHWGEQSIPIRNLIVMINNKPIGRFKYVSVKLLKELNDYVQYFEPILTDKQLNRITNGFLSQ